MCMDSTDPRQPSPDEAPTTATEEPDMVVIPDPLDGAATFAPIPTAKVPETHHKIVSSAAVIMVGNLLSSVLGFVRLETINAFFYDAVSGGAFVFALRPVQQISDLLAGGSVSGALIPTFVDYS